MENTTTNGRRPSLTPTALLPPGPDAGMPKYARILDLVRQTIDAEVKLNELRTRLDAEVKNHEPTEMPSILVSLLAGSRAIVVPPRIPSTTLVEVQRPKRLIRGTLEAEIMGLMSDSTERTATETAHRLGRNPKSIYAALQRLVRCGTLVRTKRGYRLKLRRPR